MSEGAAVSDGGTAAAQRAEEPQASPCDASEGPVGGSGTAAAVEGEAALAAAVEGEAALAAAPGGALQPPEVSALLPDPDDDGLSFSYDGEEMEELEEEEEVEQVRAYRAGHEE